MVHRWHVLDIVEHVAGESVRVEVTLKLAILAAYDQRCTSCLFVELRDLIVCRGFHFSSAK